VVPLIRHPSLEILFDFFLNKLEFVVHFNHQLYQANPKLMLLTQLLQLRKIYFE